MTEKRHLLSILVDNEPGVLSRIVGLFSGRGYNIESLCVAETMDPAISRITMTTKGNPMIIEQIKKQLNKLIDVIRVTDVTKNNYFDRELVLVKVNCPPSQRGDVSQVVSIFNAKVVDIGPKSMTLEVVGSEQKIDAFLETVRMYGFKEVARTGPISMIREAQKKK